MRTATSSTDFAEGDIRSVIGVSLLSVLGQRFTTVGPGLALRGGEHASGSPDRMKGVDPDAPRRGPRGAVVGLRKRGGLVALT